VLHKVLFDLSIFIRDDYYKIQYFISTAWKLELSEFKILFTEMTIFSYNRVFLPIALHILRTWKTFQCHEYCRGLLISVPCAVSVPPRNTLSRVFAALRIRGLP